MDDITENFVTACLIKEQAFLNQHAEIFSRKLVYGWMDNIANP